MLFNFNSIMEYLLNLKQNFDKRYLIVPISMAIASIYVYYNKTHVIKRLVDPGDGSPEVMEISEEPASLNDYLIASVGIGVLTFVAIYFSNYSSDSSTNSITSNSTNSTTNSTTNNTTNNSGMKQEMYIPKMEQRPVYNERIKTGPANF